jgi:multisubunit Na+/H+ antiporter MnhB subunit
MRALCGAIITAGALIGLGLSAIGIGLRYQAYPYLDETSKPQWVLFRHIDTSLMVALVALLVTLVIGLGVAFVGLAYHHHRRHHEFLREHGGHPAERTHV